MKKIVAFLLVAICAVGLYACNDATLQIKGRTITITELTTLLQEVNTDSYNQGVKLDGSMTGKMSMKSNGTQISQNINSSAFMQVYFGQGLADYQVYVKIETGGIEGMIGGYQSYMVYQNATGHYQSDGVSKDYYDSTMTEEDYQSQKETYQSVIGQITALFDSVTSILEFEEYVRAVQEIGFEIKLDEQGNKKVIGLCYNGNLHDILIQSGMSSEDMGTDIAKQLKKTKASFRLLINIENNVLTTIESDQIIKGTVGTLEDFNIDVDLKGKVIITNQIDFNAFPTEQELAQFR